MMNRKPQIETAHLDALRKFKADTFQVLAHPTRIQIIETLREGELSVGAILEHVKVKPANISQHLALLRWSLMRGRIRTDQLHQTPNAHVVIHSQPIQG